MARSLRRLHVTVVAHNWGTLRGLSAYLSRAGITTTGTRFLEQLMDLVPPWTAAVVLFPDEFKLPAVLDALAGLREGRPSALPILVTQDWKDFEKFLVTPGAWSPLVVAKPVWAWMILDAIRARLADAPDRDLN